MEETAQSTGQHRSWIIILLGVILFGLSLGAGYYWGREEGEQVAIQPTTERGPAPVEYIQPGLEDAGQVYPDPGPVELTVASEIDGVSLSGEVNAEVLEQWWQVLRVDSQAVRLKELGGNVWYAPEQVRIVFKDITPLTTQQRQALYKTVSDGLGGEPVAGVTTRVKDDSAEEIEYWIYADPILFPADYPLDVNAENVNRNVFEVLYEAVVGSTAMTPDDFQRKRDEVFENWDGDGLVDVMGVEEQSRVDDSNSKKDEILSVANSLQDDEAGEILSVVDSLQDDMWREILSVADSLKDDITGLLVGQVYAQSCSGTFHCGAYDRHCRCSTTNVACSPEGSSCGSSTNPGTCECENVCESNGDIRQCSGNSANLCRPRQCSQCAPGQYDTCYWGGGGGPIPGLPTNTPAPAQGTDRCRVAGRVERYNDLNLRNAGNVVSFRSLDTNSYSTDTVGTYSVEKNYANVGSTFEVYVNNPYGSYRTFEVKGNVPGGCSVVDNNRTIRCPKSVCYNRSEGLLSFNFEEVAPAANNCSLPQITGTSRNCSGDGRSVTVSWQNVGCSQYRVQYTTSSNFTGTVYSTDVSGHSTTIGNLTANQTWYFRVACRASSTCTPVMSGSYYTYGAVAGAKAL
jgi:hypothetical protein